MTGAERSSNPALAAFAEEAQRALGDNFVAIIEYGPVFEDASPAPAAKSARLLVLCKRVGPDVTTTLRAPLARASRSLEIASVLFSEQEFLDSLDVFPVEAGDISASYRVLAGRDVVCQAKTTDRNLRHQLEFELRSKKLFLLSQLLRHDEESAPVGRALVAFYEALMGLARHYFLLKGKDVVASRAALIRELETDPGIPSGVLERLGEVASGRASIGPTEKSQLVWGFLSAVDHLTEAIDRLEAQ